MPEKQRIAIFAHYDKDNIIDDYVIFYLNRLKEVAQKIIFVSACSLIQDEQSKISSIVDKIIAEKHDEYDFGSYKRGFLFAIENNWTDVEEYIFANDSCYGPFYSLKKVFSEMETRNCDFWGIIQNYFGFIKCKNQYNFCVKPHIQSYFMVFKKQVFQSSLFIDFVRSIKKEDSKKNVILNYEIGLSELLYNAGFTSDSFVKDFREDFSPFLYNWQSLILNSKMPFLKCSIPRMKYQNIVLSDEFKEVITNISDYDINLIDKNLQHTKLPTTFWTFLPKGIKKFILLLKFKLKMMLINLNMYAY